MRAGGPLRVHGAGGTEQPRPDEPRRAGLHRLGLTSTRIRESPVASCAMADTEIGRRIGTESVNGFGSHPSHLGRPPTPKANADARHRIGTESAPHAAGQGDGGGEAVGGLLGGSAAGELGLAGAVLEEARARRSGCRRCRRPRRRARRSRARPSARPTSTAPRRWPAWPAPGRRARRAASSAAERQGPFVQLARAARPRRPGRCAAPRRP